MHTVQYLQGFAGLAWALVAVCMAPATWRSMFGEPRYLDPVFATFFFVGVLQAGFVLRWVLWNETLDLMEAAELNLWTALYALCGLLALWALIVARAYCDKQL